MIRGTVRGLFGAILLICSVGCSTTEPSQTTPKVVKGETTSEPIQGVRYPAKLRTDTWYVSDTTGRYQFTPSGGEFQKMVPSLLGLKDSILCKSPSSDYYLLGFSENEGRAYIQYYSAKNVLGLAIRLDKDDALLSTFSKLYEEVGVSIMLDGEGKAYVNPSDASKPAIAASGDWVTLISEAAVEAGDTTLRISWENSDEQLLKIFECNKDPEMLRIEDDGLKLVRIDDPETVYFLR